jgi:hypothetical protein
VDYYMLVMHNNHVAKIGTLGPAAPIFAEMTYVDYYMLVM